jgi:hypothetical protein
MEHWTMNPTMSDITIAIVLVGVNVALFVWFRRSVAADSARRMMGMMKRLGLEAGIAATDDPRTEAILKETRRRCRRCPREDFCNWWLAGKVKGDNTFCPNAQAFGSLAKTSGRMG